MLCIEGRRHRLALLAVSLQVAAWLAACGNRQAPVVSPPADEPKRDGTAQEQRGHGHGAHDHGPGGHDHGLAHTTPVSLLFGILGALLVLTIATVAVTAIDLGAQGNLVSRALVQRVQQ